MSARIAKLEALLTRIQERAAEPRPLTAVAAAATSAQAAEDEAEEESLDEPAVALSPVAEIDDLDDLPLEESPAPSETQDLDEPQSLDEIQDLDEIQELDDVELDEPDIPISGPVQAAEPTIDDAIDAAAHQPPVTPPPESGEGLAQPQIPANVGPTMEQLGQTIALEEGGVQEFELDEPTLDETGGDETARGQAPTSDRGVVLSQPPRSQEELTLPENAREELDRVRLGDTTPLEARVSSRPVISTNVVDLVSSAREFAPKSFLDLLDASLKLK